MAKLDLEKSKAALGVIKHALDTAPDVGKPNWPWIAAYHVYMSDDRTCNAIEAVCTAAPALIAEVEYLRAELAELAGRRCETCARYGNMQQQCYEIKAWACPDWESKEKEEKKSCEA